MSTDAAAAPTEAPVDVTTPAVDHVEGSQTGWILDVRGFSVDYGYGTQAVRAVDRVDLLQAGLDRLGRDATVEQVYGHDWIRDPYSKGTWLACRPGQAADFAELGTRWGSIHLAGADFAQVWGGWVDGAVESGRLAAAAVHAELG